MLEIFCYSNGVKIKYRIIIFILVVAGVSLTIWQSALTPRNDHAWQEQYDVLPYAEFNENLVTVHNVRNFRHTSVTERTPGYYDKTYNLDKLEKVYFIVEAYSKFRGAAHTFLSFEFANATFVAITVEARLEKNEQYSPLAGLFKQYELIYVVGDERDVIKQRTNNQRNGVYLYPVKTTKEKARLLFTDMLARANELKATPQFYNTISDSCTTSIVKHVNKITPNKISFSYKYLLPGYSDELAYSAGLLDISDSPKKIRKQYYVTDRAQAADDDENFSLRIRQQAL